MQKGGNINQNSSEHNLILLKNWDLKKLFIIVENQLFPIFYILKLSHDLKFNHVYIFFQFIIRDGNWQFIFKTGMFDTNDVARDN